ncbi:MULTISPECIES: GntR family transcriptional regulator [Rhodococcus]|jgi:GntR family transcriptional regulator|uniref:GntR family transcriptional regulator n=1 Tax=Rhodococcus baikonurensis TaxID=172041 RepID=A0ABV5XB47_9NOCA|nr:MULTISPECIES: GntR family transcriptional regulator [Rhodococcus]NHP13172.1 GntR family transcriptional regulator [Rhodococcus sp. IC4_135]MBJ7479007.1 GntR family transcriptional regulator [Rhodococcus sp. (in: high G+C Gram-positive bacteria)]MDI9956186.1 GntR family transcriptional regulator [Rhodococcus sp. IEGM 1237]MDI9965663.1 GntR family transcriptional regulator [Rhodococcus sp. IEGM 1251]MDV8124759.1 GntR family transcriptional regulator [Rhodococcus sp. IEGM 1304]
MNQQTSTGPGTSSVVIEPELKYYRVRTEIETILSGLDEGDSVPSERELAARFTVARETVRQALRDLLVEGRIERRGRGTVVASPKLVQPLSIRSYTEGALSAGRVPSRKVVTFERMSADDGLATELGIELGDSVVHLERVLFADGEKIGLESTFLPDSRFGEMLDAFDATTSLYAAIRSIGVVFASATERIETVLASPREATLVESTTSMPMLLLHRTSVDPEGVPIERVRSLYRGDRIAFLTTLRE